MNHRVAIFRLLGLHFQQEVTLKHLLYSKEKPVNHWLTGLVAYLLFVDTMHHILKAWCIIIWVQF